MMLRDWYGVLFTMVALLGTRIETLAEDASAPKPGSAEYVAKIKGMIHDLGNTRNTRPKVVRRGGSGYPIFQEDYDEAEQRRVKGVLIRLVGEMGDDLWPLLLDVHDTRYALTFDADDRAENRTVDSLCSEMVDDLLVPFDRHQPKEDLGNNYRLYPKSDWSPFAPGERISEWAAKRPGKKLHELQVEICEMAIAAVPMMKKPTEKEKDAFIRGLTGEIETIRKTGQPVVLKTRFRGEYYATYSAKRIGQYRERYGKLAEDSKEEK